MTSKYTSQELAELASKFYTEIKENRAESRKRNFVMGSILKRIKDEKLYRFLDCDTFEEFLALPDLGIRRSTAFLYMKIYDFFIEKHPWNLEQLYRVDISKLQMILPIVEEFPNEIPYWIDYCETLSKTDLKKIIAEKRGEEYVEPKIKKQKEEIELGKRYIDYVRGHSCVVCAAPPPSDPAHFPRTRGANATDDESLPLCRKCHSRSHAVGFDTFLIQNKYLIFQYFYKTIRKAVEILNKDDKIISQ